MKEIEFTLEERIANLERLVLFALLGSSSYYRIVTKSITDVFWVSVATRNYLTHYDSSLKEQSAQGWELYEVTQKLRIILEACLLAELGFNFEEIKNLFSRNRRYKMET